MGLCTGGAYTWTTFWVFGGEIEHGKHAHCLNVFVKLLLQMWIFLAQKYRYYTIYLKSELIFRGGAYIWNGVNVSNLNGNLMGL